MTDHDAPNQAAVEPGISVNIFTPKLHEKLRDSL